jgi:hypothetical protein
LTAGGRLPLSQAAYANVPIYWAIELLLTLAMDGTSFSPAMTLLPISRSRGPFDIELRHATAAQTDSMSPTATRNTEPYRLLARGSAW